MSNRKVSGENLVSRAFFDFQNFKAKFGILACGLGFNVGDPGLIRTSDLLLRRPFQLKSNKISKAPESPETRVQQGFVGNCLGLAEYSQKHRKVNLSGEQLVNSRRRQSWRRGGIEPPA